MVSAPTALPAWYASSELPGRMLGFVCLLGSPRFPFLVVYFESSSAARYAPRPLRLDRLI